MNKELLCFVIVAGVISYLFVPVTAITISGGYGSSEGSFSFSQNAQLGIDTSFSSDVSVGSGGLLMQSHMQGTGYNRLTESTSSNGKRVTNQIDSVGSVSTSSSSQADAGGVIAANKVRLSGDSGYIHAGSVSASNEMTVVGWFAGGGSLDEDILTASSNMGSYVDGTVSSDGVSLYNNEIAQSLASEELMMSVSGVSVAEGASLGLFGLLALNQAVNSKSPLSVGPFDDAKMQSLSGTNHPEIVVSGNLGNANSYTLAGWQIGSPLQLYLRDDIYLQVEQLNPTDVANAIGLASGTWDYWVEKSLFNDNVVTSKTAPADKADYLSVHAFKPISGSALAYARTWYYSSTKNVRESDVVYNTRYSWTTDWNKAKTTSRIDVQTVALHEIGHSAGMGDIYPWSSDWYQVMNSYDGPQHYLGLGDLTGLQLKYPGNNRAKPS